MNTTLFNGGFLHGGDYNPDQWLDSPEILEQDIILMKKAHINVVSIGIFSWSLLEPREGVYDFDWLEKIINRLYENGIYSVLATPSGAKPSWMSEKYEEIRRCDSNGVRHGSGCRHNHCMTSPVYRKFVHNIDTALAKRFANNPAVILWHIGNEFGGECFCPLCCNAFRDWLKVKYKTLDNLNKTWCTAFWSHIFTDFSQIYPPTPNGEHDIQGLNSDWKRFMTDQTADFIEQEIKAVKAVNPNIPATTNIMGFYGYNYFKLKNIVDVISWDSYPHWHAKDDIYEAMHTACTHDLMRSIKPEKPFLLMESAPSTTSARPVCKLKRPHVHYATSMQAIAHGSDSIQYFQIRKSRNNVEKFHGAVIDHYGKENRVFGDVRDLGEKLEKIKDVQGSSFTSEVAVIFDYENRFAVDDSQGPRNIGMDYEGDIHRHYNAFWKMGINVDVVDMDSDISKYKIVVAPMLYMYRGNIAEKMREFVQNGGTLIGTYRSGIVDENNLCYLGGVPGEGMMDVFGIWNEEIDALYDNDQNTLVMNDKKEYKINRLCALIHEKTAKVLARYGEDFYKDTPALTVNEYGKGKAYYIAAATGEDFLDNFYKDIAKECDVSRSIDIDLPLGVSAHTRHDGDKKYIFIENYSAKEVELDLPKKYTVFNGELGEWVDNNDKITLRDYDVCILCE